MNSGSYQGAGLFSNLSGSTYTVQVKDSNNCVTTLSVPVHEPAVLDANHLIHNVSCAGGNNGSISLNVNGGTAPYLYIWSNNTYNGDIFNLYAGTYSVRVVDNHGCVFKDTLEVTQPANPLIVNGVVTDATSSVNPDGTITTTVTGGVTPYAYSWSNSSTTKDQTHLYAGNYTVNVIDANGCITSGVFAVGGPLGITNVNGEAISMVLYPNPSSETATIEVKGSTISHIQVISMSGAIVMESDPKQSSVQINSSTLASGVYFVKVLVEGNTITKRMIVSK
jgi:hypothetical protein